MYLKSVTKLQEGAGLRIAKAIARQMVEDGVQAEEEGNWMGKEFVYIRAVRILVPRKLVEAGRIYAIKRWAENMGEIARNMEKHTSIKIAFHLCNDYVFVLCRNDLEARLVYEFLQEKIGEEIDIAKAFPQITKEDYEKLWGAYAQQ